MSWCFIIPVPWFSTHKAFAFKRNSFTHLSWNSCCLCLITGIWAHSVVCLMALPSLWWGASGSIAGSVTNPQYPQHPQHPQSTCVQHLTFIWGVKWLVRTPSQHQMAFLHLYRDILINIIIVFRSFSFLWKYLGVYISNCSIWNA